MDYKIEILLSFLKILIPFILISYSSLFITRIIKISDFLEKILIIFILNWVQILICIQLFSIFNKVSLFPIAIFHAVTFFIVLIISRLKKINFKINLKSVFLKFYYFFQRIELNKIFKILIFFLLLVIILVSFYKGIIIPPFNYDSMTYHLARAGFWMQNQSINHYPTTAEFQNLNPFNAEIALLWIMIFTNSDNITFIVQFISFLIILLALYKVLRLLGFNKAVSIVTIFIFSTLDMVILQSYTTQNDLVIACFLVVTLYFLIKVVRDEKVDLKNIIFASIALGIAIGTKGYSYLVVPGFIVFLIISSKNNKIKFLKLSYLLIFSILGVFLFAGYSFVQNYISYNNIFTSNEYAELLAINSPTLKTFASNIIRYLISFYQLHYSRFDVIGKLIRDFVVKSHHRLGIDISSPITTFQNTAFYFSNIKLNFDESYFGPFYFFTILPSLIYNFFIFLVFRLWRKGKKLIHKMKYSLSIIIIPLLFFIMYTIVFKWQPYTGRLMISVASLSMISFGLMMELLFQVNKKYLFQIVSFILVILTAILSFFPLFKEDYVNLTKLNFNVEYDQRRPSFIKDGQELLSDNIKSPYKIGLVLHGGDWVYLLFGKDYSNKLYYIPKEIWNEKKIPDILTENGFDGILVNKNAEVFLNDYYPIYSKLTNNLLLKIDKENFNEYLRPLTCDLVKSKKGIIMKTYNDDPYFETTFPLDIDNKEIIVKVSFELPTDAHAQFFYKFTDKEYNEDDSEWYKIKKGQNNLYIYIRNTRIIEKIRMDLINKNKSLLINSIEIYDLADIKFKEQGKYILFFD